MSDKPKENEVTKEDDLKKPAKPLTDADLDEATGGEAFVKISGPVWVKGSTPTKMLTRSKDAASETLRMRSMTELYQELAAEGTEDIMMPAPRPAATPAMHIRAH